MTSTAAKPASFNIKRDVSNRFVPYVFSPQAFLLYMIRYIKLIYICYKYYNSTLISVSIGFLCFLLRWTLSSFEACLSKYVKHVKLHVVSRKRNPGVQYVRLPVCLAIDRTCQQTTWKEWDSGSFFFIFDWNLTARKLFEVFLVDVWAPVRLSSTWESWSPRSNTLSPVNRRKWR